MEKYFGEVLFNIMFVVFVILFLVVLPLFTLMIIGGYDYGLLDNIMQALNKLRAPIIVL